MVPTGSLRQGTWPKRGLDWISGEPGFCRSCRLSLSAWAQWHRLNLADELIASMPPKRQSPFRGVYAHDFTARPHEAGDNRHYSTSNRSL